MDEVFIKDLSVRCVIGLCERERQAAQEILVNVSLFTGIRRAAKSDDIADCVDYDALAKEIRALAERARRFTAEALATDIAYLCLSRPGVRKVRVRIEKPGAVEGAVSVGVEIERSNKNRRR